MSKLKETDFGYVPITWKISTLGNISQLLTDGSHLSPKPISSCYFMASVKDMRYNHFDFNDCKTISKNDFDLLIKNNCNPKHGDILLSKDGANCLDIIFVYKQEEEIVLLSSIAIARLKEGYNPDFYRYFLLSPNVQDMMRNNFVSGSAIPRVILKDFKNVPVPLIHYDEQTAIAGVLNSIDDKIDLLHCQNKTLEALAETLFRQWFTEESNENWEEGTIDSLIEIQSGFAFKSTDFAEQGKYKLVTIKNVQDGYLDLSSTNFINEIPNRMPEYCLLQQGDILISLTGNVGRCCLITEENLFLNQRVAKLKARNNRDWAFTYIMFRQVSMRRMLEELAKGTAQANLSPIETGKMKIQIPQMELLQNYSVEVTPLLEKVIKNKNQIKTLAKLRDTLLPKLMSGEVRVEN